MSMTNMINFVSITSTQLINHIICFIYTNNNVRIIVSLETECMVIFNSQHSSDKRA